MQQPHADDEAGWLWALLKDELCTLKDEERRRCDNAVDMKEKDCDGQTLTWTSSFTCFPPSVRRVTTAACSMAESVLKRGSKPGWFPCLSPALRIETKLRSVWPCN